MCVNSHNLVQVKTLQRQHAANQLHVPPLAVQ